LIASSCGRGAAAPGLESQRVPQAATEEATASTVATMETARFMTAFDRI
jgi:hypothetical protein